MLRIYFNFSEKVGCNDDSNYRLRPPEESAKVPAVGIRSSDEVAMSNSS